MMKLLGGVLWGSQELILGSYLSSAWRGRIVSLAWKDRLLSVESRRYSAAGVVIQMADTEDFGY